MTRETLTEEVKYEGYNPSTERCHFSVPSGWGTATPTPNARLISAAPDLLKAAKRVAAWYGGGELGETIDQLREAIAKAEE